MMTKHSNRNIRPDSQRYAIQDNTHYFTTGATGDGTLLLVGVSYPGMVALEFAPDGCFTQLRRRALSRQITCNADGYFTPTDEEEAAIARDRAAWCSELGMTSRTIVVKRFSCEGFSIEDVPGYLFEILEPDSDYDEEEREQAREDLRTWIEAGDYILTFNEEYFMDEEGDVASS